MPQIYKSKQASNLIGLSVSTLNKLRKQGVITFIQLSKGRVGYLEADLTAYLDAQRTGGAL